MSLPTRQPLPRGVWALGFVSLFMDASSEMIHSLLPAFLVSVVGAGGLAVGLIEGAAEATALVVKVFSGAFSDFLGKRKALALGGYGLSALTKPLFALAMGVQGVFAARFLDRIGKGIRGAPRDALVADLTPEAVRGAAYGLRQTLDTVGAFLGPLFAMGLMVVFAGNFRTVFWFACFPAALSVAFLAAGVKDARPSARRPPRTPIEWKSLSRFSSAFWRVVLLGSVFALARFSEAFLILRALRAGIPNTYAPGVFVLMNVAYALSAYPAGLLADRGRRKPLLAGGLLILMASDLFLAWGQGFAALAAGVLLWGFHMGLTQGLFSFLVASESPEDLRGTAFGLFNLAGGAATLLSGVVAGVLWDKGGPSATFLAGAGFAAAALGLVLFQHFKKEPVQ